MRQLIALRRTYGRHFTDWSISKVSTVQAMQLSAYVRLKRGDVYIGNQVL